MSEAYVGEIRMFAGNFAPRAWALCDGQLQLISQNNALFSLLGTIYGGDGRTTFGLPDMRGRIPIHWGSGPGLTPRTIGQKTGRETVTLVTANLPSHTHPMQATNDMASSTSPTDTVPAMTEPNAYNSAAPSANMNAEAITRVGDTRPHENLQPFQCVNFIISLSGVYPSRS